MAAPNLETNRRRQRVRERLPKREREKIATRVIDFFNEDLRSRADDQSRRLERYAKVRGWTSEDTGDPWPGSSDIALPDMATAVEQTQDTLVNAALATRPTMNAKSMSGKGQEAERKLSQLLDAQFYEEQEGESVMHELAQTFVEDGSFVAFVPWVKEWRYGSDTQKYPPLSDRDIPRVRFASILQERFPGWDHFALDEEGWSWRVEQERDVRQVEFYTDDTEVPENAPVQDPDVVMVVSYRAKVHDGPRVLVKDYEDVLTPPRSANLQIPGPANPGGAPHVILRDFPTYDEIVRLQESRSYDLVSQRMVKELKGRQDTKDVPEKDQKDVMQGEEQGRTPRDDTEKTLTRLMCFDIWDFGDGRGPVDVIWTVLKEPRLLVRAKRLTELYPVPDGGIPMRPLAEASYLPVKGRRQGRSLPEMMEGLHDYIKERWDQVADAGDMATTPFGFYDPSTDMNPEIATIAPGQMYPVRRPKDTIVFPQIPTNGMAFGLNLIAAATQLSEKLVVLGDLQQGRIPAGRSSAFRTTGNLQTLLAQGEARPERILRRYFMGLKQIWMLMHRLNQFHMPAEKMFRVVGFMNPDENPYQSITRDEINNDRFLFSFEANIQNASLQAQQDALMLVHQILIDPVAIQSGVVTPDTIYRLKRDLVRSTGNDPDPYLVAPTPISRRQPITAEAALGAILNDELPDGFPAEGAEEHLMKLQKLLQKSERGPDGLAVKPVELFDQRQRSILEEYLKGVSALVQREREQQRLVQASVASQQQAQQAQGPGAPTTTPPPQSGLPQVGPGELSDESLPTAGGGTVQ